MIYIRDGIGLLSRRRRRQAVPIYKEHEIIFLSLSSEYNIHTRKRIRDARFIYYITYIIYVILPAGEKRNSTTSRIYTARGGCDCVRYYTYNFSIYIHSTEFETDCVTFPITLPLATSTRDGLFVGGTIGISTPHIYI